MNTHGIHEDEADRHAKPRHVPIWLVILVAAAVVAVLAYLHWRGVA